MKCSSYYPVLMTADVAATAAFYCRTLGFRALYETEWYVHLQSAEDETVNLGILHRDHETVPAAHRGRSAAGLLLNFEVADVDAVHARLAGTGLRLVQPLRDEPFGQRHFIAEGPEGVLIDIITPIPPAPEFAAAYVPGAAP
jgi:catechol 2,3-dioxygenase-like lactoylglutathione lyase family enzyme